jgi:hypothetical protein
MPIEIKMRGSDSKAFYSTRDVSHRGVFVVTDHPLPEDSPIEFTMNLKSGGAMQPDVRVVCKGTVVRVEHGDGDNAGIAVTIDSYRFLHATRGTA